MLLLLNDLETNPLETLLGLAMIKRQIVELQTENQELRYSGNSASENYHNGRDGERQGLSMQLVEAREQIKDLECECNRLKKEVNELRNKNRKLELEQFEKLESEATHSG